MDYKIIVLDLDGTLTNQDKVVTPRTREALMRAQEAGKIVVLASGRPTPGVMPLARELKLDEHDGYILSFNGGMIVSCRTGEVVFSSQLPAEANGRVIDLAREHRVDIMTYEGDKIIASNASYRYIALESRVCHMEVKEIGDPEEMKRYVTFSVPKFILTEEGDYLAAVEPKVKAVLGESCSVYRSDSYYLEVLPRGIDKANALRRFLETSGYRREEMIACGDGYNDLSMVRFAGLGVALSMPTSAVVIVLSLMLCPASFVALMSWMRHAVRWYMIFACVIAAFVVALVSMDGWERIREIWERTGYKDGR